jgi:hypothetical protein
VSAPPQAVFQQAADFPRAADRIRGILRIEMLTDGPVRVGTRFKETRMMFKRECTEQMEVSAFEPPHRYTLTSISCGCRYEATLRFTPARGGTDVEMTFDAQPLTFLAKLMSFMMRPMMKSCMKLIAQDLADLKRAIEGTSGGLGPSSAVAQGS